MSARCPEGHLSHDPDYCDQCGLRIVGGQDRYGYRQDDGGRGAGYPAAAPAGRSADPYGRRAPEREPSGPPGPGGGQGYDPLGIRRAPAEAAGVADPPRGAGRGGDPYGGYGREGYAEDPRAARGYSDPYARDGGYGRPSEERARPDGRERPREERDPYARDDRSGFGGREDPEPGFGARDDRTPPGYGRDGYGAGRGEPEPGFPRGRDDRGGYGAPEARGGYGAGEPGRPMPDADNRRGYRDNGSYGTPGGGYGVDPLSMPGAGSTPVPAGPGTRDRAADRYAPCPNCRSLNDTAARFCEGCGLDFSTGQLPGPGGASALDDAGATSRQAGPRRGSEARHGTDPRIADPRLGDPRLGDPRAGDPRSAGRGREWDDAPALGTWEAVVEAEREYYDSGDDHRVPFPAFYPRRVFALTDSQMLIGRRSESRGINPEIDLSGAPEDPGISRAHATLERMPDGTYAVRDPGSTNGTRLNDEPDPIEPGRAIPLRDGDRVYVGAWTRITVRAQ
ncbi:FHA domain-containing protein [Frankia sp. EI5c]|uniref:FHA domain-containing protein n=1 Tax=Frankia sp. EI5c TaxID=683316 RepID=UPI0007C3FF98|nr:FHA domain-containing protein [Frankia sp. EI5c]OAA27009.1 FHA domain-containing protein [Frankia sp. EI5c]